jgi:polar amino acid transport system ATP-binding protein
MRFAREVSDRVCFFDKGRIVEQAPPTESMVQPQEQHTQMFLRSILGNRGE